jgi:hypothetical protein
MHSIDFGSMSRDAGLQSHCSFDLIRAELEIYTCDRDVTNLGDGCEIYLEALTKESKMNFLTLTYFHTSCTPTSRGFVVEP